MLTSFTVLRFLNLEFEEIYGFRILNPALIGIVIGYFFGLQIEKERESRKLAISDPVSGLHNRAGLTSFVEKYFSQNPDKINISIITIDIDDFKNVNDSYGHQIGDIALSRAGAIIKKNTRSTDIAARCGGDEFIIALPGANYDIAMKIAETILNKINTTKITSDRGEQVKLSFSIGIAAAENSSVSEGYLFKLSDQKLYEAKKLGKNRICGTST